MTGGYRLRTERLHKNYGTVAALSAVTLDVQPGRFLVLLGPSGSGKSTLARVLAGIERADSGEVHLGDVLADDGRRHLPPERRDLAMVFQDYALWPHMTAVANVAYALRRRRLDGQTARRRAAAALDRMGLGHLAARYPQELSGGEQQRVALARAVVAEPRLLIFDEPLSNLDADLRERLRIEISTLTRDIGATAVYITHDQAEAFALADDVGVLERGRLVQFDTPEQIYRAPADPFVARFTGVAVEVPGIVSGRSGDGLVVEVAGGRLLARSSQPMSTMSTGAAALVFVRAAGIGLADRLPCGREPGPGSLAGVVVDVAFRGSGYEHVVETPCGPVTGVFAQRSRARGSDVLLTVAADGCLVYPADGSAAGGRQEPAVKQSAESDCYDLELTTVTPEPAVPAQATVEGDNA